MPSIFVWKSTIPNTSTKQIRHYSGSNWFMEDNDYSSKSYKYLEQIVISDSNSNDSVITYNVKCMPQDWVGSELLEVSCVPYKLIKSDNYGTLEMIGSWMRFTSCNEFNFEDSVLQQEFNKIKSWINTNTFKSNEMKHNESKYKPCPANNVKPKYNPKYDNQINANYDDIQMNFQEFLSKYSMPNMGYTNTSKYNKYQGNLNRNY